MSQNRKRYITDTERDGYRRQSAMGIRSTPRPGTVANGPSTAVVLAVYYSDDQKHILTPEVPTLPDLNPDNFSPAPVEVDAPFLTVDVLVYSSAAEAHVRLLLRVPVVQGYASLQDGDVFVPRASSIRLDGQPLEEIMTNYRPHQLDGDHCFVEYMENDPSKPFIRSFFRPLNADTGTVDRPGARTVAVKRAEGRPRLTKHAGVTSGVDTNGNAILDLSRAHTQLFDEQGREPRLATDPAASGDLEVPTDGSSGNRVVTLRAGSVYTVKISPDPNAPEVNATTLEIGDSYINVQFTGGQVFRIEPAGSLLNVSGNAATRDSSFLDEIQSKYDELKAQLDSFDSKLAEYTKSVNEHAHVVSGTDAKPSPTLTTASPGSISAPEWGY